MTASMRTPQAWLARGGTAVVISLEALKEQVRWDAIRTPTSNTLERLFRAKLGPSDRFVQINEIVWLVVMPDTDLNNALSCCLRIAYQLHLAVTPACELSQLKVLSATATADDTLEVTPLTDEQLRAAAHRAGLDNLVAALPALPEEPADTSNRFEPIWDAQRQIVSGYRCLPDGGVGGGDSVAQQLKRTHAMLVGTARVLEKHLVQGERCIVFAPIPYEVLSAPPARMELLATCRQLKCDLRPLLMFEIATIGAGIPKHRLAEIIASIQPFARAVIARSVSRNRSLMDYGGTGLKGLGLELSGSHADESEICRLCNAGKRIGVATYLGNVASEKVLDQGATLGAQWISGPIIGAPVSEPAPPSRLPLETILENFEQRLHGAPAAESDLQTAAIA